MRVLYSGNTKPCQGLARGSIPLTRSNPPCHERDYTLGKYYMNLVRWPVLSFLKYAILPGIIASFSANLLVRLMLVVPPRPESLDLLLILVFFLLPPFFSALFSLIKTVRLFIVVSVLYAIISVTTYDFVNSLILGFENQSDIGWGQNISRSSLIIPLTSEFNYSILRFPQIVVGAVIFLALLIKIVYLNKSGFWNKTDPEEMST